MAQMISHFQEDSNSAPKQAVTKLPRRKGNPLKVLIPLVLLLGGVGLGTYTYLSRPVEEGLTLSGRIEGYETKIGAKVGGRIGEVTVREGDRVQAGQVIAKLDAMELQAQLEAAKGRIAAAQQKVNQAALQINVIESQIEEAQLSEIQAKDDALGRINQAQESVASAQAQYAQAVAQVERTKAELALAQADRDRYAKLVEEGVIPRQQFDQIATRFNTAKTTVLAQEAAAAAAQKQVQAAQGGLQQAQSSRLNPGIRAARVEGLKAQKVQAEAQFKAAQAEVYTTQAQAQEIVARLQDLNIVSPITGVVLTRNVEPGEVIGVGKTLLTVVNLDQVYLRGYIPEGKIGNVRVGQTAEVFLDSAPETPLQATVTQIDTEASFTPENIYFKEDRVTQVFGVKLAIANPAGYAKPGMPADGAILIEEQRPDTLPVLP